MPRLVCAAALLLAALPAAAQDSTAVEPLASPTLRFDARLFRAVYANEAPAFVGAMHVAEATSLPVMFGAVPAAAVVSLTTDVGWDPTVRLAAAEGGAFAVVLALKNAVRRPRPYRALRDVRARSRRHQAERVLDPHSFPSGHSALSFAVATSVSLSADRWYVTAPALTWASAVALARVWHGVHYPLDIATGALIGAGSAVAVHLLAPSVDGEGDPAGTLGGDPTALPAGAVVVPLVRVAL